MPKCMHDPVSLFDAAPKGNEGAAVMHFLCPYARGGWVICRKCGHTGYWGGYGMRRRARWGFGGEPVLKAAEHHNRLMRGEVVQPGQFR